MVLLQGWWSVSGQWSVVGSVVSVVVVRPAHVLVGRQCRRWCWGAGMAAGPARSSGSTPRCGRSASGSPAPGCRPPPAVPACTGGPGAAAPGRPGSPARGAGGVRAARSPRRLRSRRCAGPSRSAWPASTAGAPGATPACARPRWCAGRARRCGHGWPRAGWRRRPPPAWP